MTITLRQTKGSELTFQELDDNFTDLNGRITTLEGSGNTDNQMLTLVGNNLSISGGNTVDLSGLGGSGVALTDLSVTVAAAGNANLTYDNATGVFTYTPPDLSSFLTSETSHADVLVDGDFTSAGFMTTDGAGNYSVDTNTYTSYNDSDVDTHLNTSTATANQILSWDGADYAWVADQTGGGSSYTDSDVDTHLNTSTATANQVLSWDGADYVWVADQTGGGGIALTDLSVTVASASGTGNLTYDNTSGAFTYTPPIVYTDSAVDLHLRTTSANANEYLFWDGADYQWQTIPTLNVINDVNFNSVTLDGSNGQGKVLAWDQTLTAFVPVDQTGGGGANVTVQDDAPTSPAPSEGDLWWESDVGVLKIYYGSTWVDASPAGSSSSGIALTDLSVTVAAAGSANLAYDNTTGAFTYTPPDLSGYLTSYTETDTLDSVVSRGATTSTTAVIPFYYANQAAFPNATTYHGAIAHSHADGSMFFAHSGSWNQLANIADLDFNTLTNQSDAYKVNIQSASLAQDHYPLMHSANTGTGITPLVDTEYRYNPDTNTLSVHNVAVLTELTAPAINPVTDTVGATGTELVINGGDATALNSQGGDLTLDAGAGAILPGEINLGVNSSNTGQINVGYSGSAVVVDGRTTFNGDVTLTTGTWETVNTSITTGAATVNVDCDDGHIVYLDASSGGFNSTFTINLVNLGNTSNVASAVTVVIKQPAGAGVLPNAIQIGGIGQTLLWQGGSAPTPNAGGNAHDVFTFSVLDLGATNVVLGQMVDYA